MQTAKNLGINRSTSFLQIALLGGWLQEGTDFLGIGV
jgi:hypothetical protein